MNVRYSNGEMFLILGVEDMKEVTDTFVKSPNQLWIVDPKLIPICNHISQRTIAIEDPCPVTMAPVYDATGRYLGDFGLCSICHRGFVRHKL
jgi:hypothetical protein